MRVTVCELPHEPGALEAAWSALCRHTMAQGSELVLLPEFAMLDPVWESNAFDHERWIELELQSDLTLGRNAELGTEYVVGTRPIRENGCRVNQGYLWSPVAGVVGLRSKYFLPEEEGSWEATWFQGGDPEFPVFRAGKVSFGLNICTELWALETYAAYAERNVDLVLAPRATALATTARWLGVGLVAAVRSGGFCLSSNLVHPSGTYGGRGWIIDPTGEVLGLTSAAEPFVTRDIDLSAAARAKVSYPCSVLSRAEWWGSSRA